MRGGVTAAVTMQDNGAREGPMRGQGGVQIVGREAESSQLYDALMLAGQGQPQVVLVAGDAGIGKTTLVADLEQRATDLGFATARGQCLDIQAEIPLAPAVAAVRVLLARVDDVEAQAACPPDATAAGPCDTAGRGRPSA